MKKINASIKVNSEDYNDQKTLQQWLKDWEYFVDQQEQFKGDWIEMTKVAVPLEAILELPEHLLVALEQDPH